MNRIWIDVACVRVCVYGTYLRIADKARRQPENILQRAHTVALDLLMSALRTSVGSVVKDNVKDHEFSSVYSITTVRSRSRDRHRAYIELRR